MAKTLYTTMTDNNGQMSLNEAAKDIKRMQKQIPGSVWEMDFSDFMYVEDESDPDVHNPCMLTPGNCWVVRIK